MPSTWRKAPAWLVETFERAFPLDPRAERRLMFGYPAGFAAGNMFTGVFQDTLFVRLGDDERQQLLALEGASVFEPMKGRPMREYVVLPADMLEEDAAVRPWMARALDFVSSLPPRTKKPAAKAKAKAKPAKKPKR